MEEEMQMALECIKNASLQIYDEMQRTEDEIYEAVLQILDELMKKTERVIEVIEAVKEMHEQDGREKARWEESSYDRGCKAEKNTVRKWRISAGRLMRPP